MLRPTWLGLRSRTTNFIWKRHYAIDNRPFAVKDHVIIESLQDRYASPTLLQLKSGHKKQTHKGDIYHDDIIGKHAREVVEARFSKRKESPRRASFRIHEVKLEEYVRLTRRLVTPLYPQDAQLIVSLLDLHPKPRITNARQEDTGPALEILEAGTGHGALTLYLSRAIHAANVASRKPDDTTLPSSSEAENGSQEEIISRWKAARNAVIHSVEISSRHSAHAEQIVRDFRDGLYYANVDFHVGSVGTWIASELTRRNREAFLSHAFLDLPATEDYLSVVTDALRVAGTLIVFNPSLTQIMDCLAKVKEEGIDLELEKVIELGVNGGTGGREWDVRAVIPRAAAAAATAALNGSEVDEVETIPEGEVSADKSPDEASVEQEEDGESDFSSLDESPYPRPAQAAKTQQKSGWKMVCRPKVGEMTVGGGFLGVFAKRRR